MSAQCVSVSCHFTCPLFDLPLTASTTPPRKPAAFTPANLQRERGQTQGKDKAISPWLDCIGCHCVSCFWGEEKESKSGNRAREQPSQSHAACACAVSHKPPFSLKPSHPPTYTHRHDDKTYSSTNVALPASSQHQQAGTNFTARLQTTVIRDTSLTRDLTHAHTHSSMALRTCCGRGRRCSFSFSSFVSVVALVLLGLTMASAFLHRVLATTTTAGTAAAAAAAAAAARGSNKASTSRMFAAATAVSTANVTPQEALAKYEELVKDLREIDALEGISGTFYIFYHSFHLSIDVLYLPVSPYFIA